MTGVQTCALPIWPFRLRMTPRASHRFRLAVHAFDAGVLARNLARPGLVMDWGHTASSGTFVLRTDNRRIVSGDREIGGAALGSLILMSDFVTDPASTAKHELVHVHQYWFLDGVLGRPVEEYLRRRVPLARQLPRWLELGVVVPGLRMAEQSIFGRDGPMKRLAESEAHMLSRP